MERPIIVNKKDSQVNPVSSFPFRISGRCPYIATPHSDPGQRTRSQNGPLPIHDVVVSAVAAAVMAATITFNSTSQKRLLFIR